MKCAARHDGWPAKTGRAVPAQLATNAEMQRAPAVASRPRRKCTGFMYVKNPPLNQVLFCELHYRAVGASHRQPICAEA